MRFDNRITVNFLIDSTIDTHFTEVPTMLFQPFVENVFVHAFNEHHPNPELTIAFQQNDHHILECTIKDNGKGLASFNKTKLHNSKGITLVKERLQLLQPEIENPITVLHTQEEGTLVTVLLKV